MLHPKDDSVMVCLSDEGNQDLEKRATASIQVISAKQLFNDDEQRSVIFQSNDPPNNALNPAQNRSNLYDGSVNKQVGNSKVALGYGAAT